MSVYPLHLYLLKLRTPYPGYDEMGGCLVAAVSATQAREIASENSGDEGGDSWMAISLTSCEMVAEVPAPDVRAGLMLRDFRAG